MKNDEKQFADDDTENEAEDYNDESSDLWQGELPLQTKNRIFIKKISGYFFYRYLLSSKIKDPNKTADESEPSASNCDPNSRDDHVNNIHMIRNKVKERILNNAQKNRHKYNRKSVVTFQVGDLISLHVPKIDRGLTDILRVSCKIFKNKKVNGSTVKFQFITYYRVLDVCYGTENSERSTSDVNCPENLLEEPILLATVSNKFNRRVASNSVSCQSKTECLSKRCACRNNGTDCTTHCPHEIKYVPTVHWPINKFHFI